MNPAAIISVQSLRAQRGRLTLLQRHRIIGHLRAGVVLQFVAMGALQTMRG